MLDNLKFHDSFSFWTEEQKQEYNSFMDEMSSVLQSNTFSTPENKDPLIYLIKISDLMCDTNNSIRQTKSFMERIDLVAIITGLEKASAQQVSNFRRGILSIYRIANVRDFYQMTRMLLLNCKMVLNCCWRRTRAKIKLFSFSILGWLRICRLVSIIICNMLKM